MIANISHPIFTLTIIILASFVRKKAKLFRGFAPMHRPGPPGYSPPPDPQLQSFLALPRTETPIFFLYYPLVSSPAYTNDIDYRNLFHYYRTEILIFCF